jgi:hypothetical protein
VRHSTREQYLKLVLKLGRALVRHTLSAGPCQSQRRLRFGLLLSQVGGQAQRLGQGLRHRGRRRLCHHGVIGPDDHKVEGRVDPGGIPSDRPLTILSGLAQT